MRNNLKDVFIPDDYFEMDSVNKETMCLFLIDKLLNFISDRYEEEYDRKHILNQLIDHSIESNIIEEQYEVAAVLRDIKKILNEQID
jgi:hypothetical protein